MNEDPADVLCRGDDPKANSKPEVFRFNAATEKWDKTGVLQTPRHSHAMSTVKWIDIKPFCDY